MSNLQTTPCARLEPERPATPTPRRSWLGPLLTDLHLRICAVLTVALFFIPPEGLSGIELCMFKRVTELPCPGCGLTRCGAHLYRGHLARAVEYNPFGLVIIAGMTGMGLLGILQQRSRNRWHRVSKPHSVALHRLAIVFTIAFVVFGLIRSVGVGVGWWKFPAMWP